jgi:nitrogen fixation NifU-like protein
LEAYEISTEFLKDDSNFLAESGYSRKAIALYKSKMNVGTIKDSNANLAYTGSCGDTIKLYLKISENGVITDVKFQYIGCPASAICGSALTQITKGKMLQDAKKITEEDVLNQLGGIPDKECHCAKLNVITLQKTISKYEEEKTSKTHP